MKNIKFEDVKALAKQEAIERLTDYFMTEENKEKGKAKELAIRDVEFTIANKGYVMQYENGELTARVPNVLERVSGNNFVAIREEDIIKMLKDMEA